MKRVRIMNVAAAATFFGVAGATAAENLFEEPKMLLIDGEPIRVESPGFAAPCWADLDRDGKNELIVGQFARGKMKIFEQENGLDFSGGEWLMVDGKPAEVPGVW